MEPVSHFKICPRCGEHADLTAQRCAACGHQYRTQFTPPQPVLAAQPPPPAPVTAPRRKPWWAWSAFAAGGLALLAAAGLAGRAAVERRFAAGSLPPAAEAAEPLYLWSGTAIATRDLDDLNLWQRSQGARVIGGGEIARSLGSDGDPGTRESLRLSRRVVLVPHVARVQLLAAQGGAARVRVLDGVEAGTVGLVGKYSLMRRYGSEYLPAFRQPVYRGPGSM